MALRRLLIFLLSSSITLLGGLPALADAAFTISAPTSITYDPAIGGFSVGNITMQDAPSYVQVALTLVDAGGTQVGPDDDFHIAVGTQCSPDYTFTNPATSGQVEISGDDTPTVIFEGSPDDVAALLTQVWIYKVNSSFCGGSGTALGQALLNRQLQVTGVPTNPGVWWSPATHHYYQLVTQTTDDGMGQPTNDQGNITDTSRYFVRWSTARAEAKSAALNLNVGGQIHRGYLAAITTKAEFAFLNNNVTGGRGKLYPAWVGGSDQGQEGNWKWVDGPEAQKFGGDSLTHMVSTDLYHDSIGNIVAPDEGGYPQLAIGDYRESLYSGILWMRDVSGNLVTNAQGYYIAVDLDSKYCTDYWANVAAADSGAMNTVQTPYGSTVICDPYSGYYIEDASGNSYFQEWGNSYDTGYFYEMDSNGNRVTDGNGDVAALYYPDDFTHVSTTTSQPNYNGAQFWGSDSGGGPGSGTPNYCTARGARGVCTVTQQNLNGANETNNYYVYWSNGDRGNSGNWDGTGNKLGDGAYSPQPDNAHLDDSPDGENALIINWCTRNDQDFSNSDAVVEDLYGNTGYHCTPGWNDLAAGDWGGASATYPNPYYQYDTPNQIGTTDFVVEYCGYSDEASCDAPSQATALTTFTQANTSDCGNSSDGNLNVSYGAAGDMATTLSSPAMVTESFDNIPQGPLTDQVTAVGYATVSGGSTGIYAASEIGGAGGTGNFISAGDVTITLPVLECYVGFWWSAGNDTNYVQLLDDSDNVLATFDASNLVSALGNCWATNGPYCGNPANGGDAHELFAYVNMRLPIGFDKIRFSGQGFEFDNVSTSVSIPDRNADETSLNTVPVNTNCSTVDSSSASATLTACPRTITVTAGTPLTYAPLDDSQIPGYSYPAGVTVTNAQVYTGLGQASWVDGSHISISSDTVGQFFVDFNITDGSQNAASRITVNVIPGQTAQVIAPVLLLLDPRAQSLTLPELPVTGGSAVTLCYRQVADAQGTSLSDGSGLTFSEDQYSGTSSGNAVGEYFTTSGSESEVQSNSGHISLSASRAPDLYNVYVEVTAVARANATASDCSGGTHQVFEIQPYGLDATQTVVVQLGRH